MTTSGDVPIAAIDDTCGDLKPTTESCIVFTPLNYEAAEAAYRELLRSDEFVFVPDLESDVASVWQTLLYSHIPTRYELSQGKQATTIIYAAKRLENFRELKERTHEPFLTVLDTYTPGGNFTTEMIAYRYYNSVYKGKETELILFGNGVRVSVTIHAKSGYLMEIYQEDMNLPRSQQVDPTRRIGIDSNGEVTFDQRNWNSGGRFDPSQQVVSSDSYAVAQGILDITSRSLRLGEDL